MRFVLWLHCLHPPTFLPKGQIIPQMIPAPLLHDTEGDAESVPEVNVVRTIEEMCKITVGRETRNIKGLLDTGVDVTIIPERMWPSHWELQCVGGHVKDVGGLQLA